MKYLSLFSGIGGFELGIQQAYEQTKSNRLLGNREQSTKEIDIRQKLSKSNNTSELGNGRGECAKCIGFSEIDKYAIQIYQKHFNHKNYGDITKINEKCLPDFDLVIGGFPCQSFSIAGKRGGFADTRGTMFFEIARIVREKQPRLLLLENVKGLLSHDKGNTFLTIISTLDELGYDLQWQVLNSKNFGVPQNRERVFIIGHLRGTPRPQVFPIGENDKKIDGKHKERKIDIVGTTVGKGKGTNSRHWVHNPNGIVGAIDATCYKQPKQILQINKPKHSNDRVYSEKGISPTLNTMQGGNRQPKIVKPVLTPNRLKKRQNGRRMKENGEPSFTLTAQDKHGIYDGVKIRRLTPTECERLQGFPDGWTEGLSDTQRYKTLGNAVTVNVVKEIVKRLL